MDTATSLLPALLEKSLTVTILAVLLGGALWAIYKLWQRNNVLVEAHNAALAAHSTQRLEDAKEYALGREKSSEHLRTMVDMNLRVLNSIEQSGKADAKDHDILVAIAVELKIPLQSFL